MEYRIHNVGLSTEPKKTLCCSDIKSILNGKPIYIGLGGTEEMVFRVRKADVRHQTINRPRLEIVVLLMNRSRDCIVLLSEGF